MNIIESYISDGCKIHMCSGGGCSKDDFREKLRILTEVYNKYFSQYPEKYNDNSTKRLLNF